MISTMTLFLLVILAEPVSIVLVQKSQVDQVYREISQHQGGWRSDVQIKFPLITLRRLQVQPIGDSGIEDVAYGVESNRRCAVGVASC